MKQEFLKKYWIFIVLLFGALYDLLTNYNAVSLAISVHLTTFLIYSIFGNKNTKAIKLFGFLLILISAFGLYQNYILTREISSPLFSKYTLGFVLGVSVLIDKSTVFQYTKKNHTGIKLLFLITILLFYSYHFKNYGSLPISEVATKLLDDIFAMLVILLTLLVNRDN